MPHQIHRFINNFGRRIERGPETDGAFTGTKCQNTEIEKALPVLADLKSTKLEVKGGLVLMMHASEMTEGNAWQKKIAKLAIEKLSPFDMVGVLYWSGQHIWPGGIQPAG